MGPVGGRGFGGSVKFADGKTWSANVPHLNEWDFDISAAEFPSRKNVRLFSAAEILLQIYQNPIHLNGTRWRFSVGELHAASKTSSANGSHLNYGILIFPQQNFCSRKTCVFGLNSI